MDDEDRVLGARWQELARQLAQLQGELGYLNSEANREQLALKRAARHVLDGLREPIQCPVETIKTDVDTLIAMNLQTDTYQEGLGAVSGVLSLLMGIAEGMKRFDTSVDGLIRQQHMHSSYLSPLDVQIPDAVTTFQAQLSDLRQKVHDEGRMCESPAEFLALMEPVMEQDLSEDRVTGMFESLGEALNAATSRWG
jgi:hypothetical protein